VDLKASWIVVVLRPLRRSWMAQHEVILLPLYRRLSKPMVGSSQGHFSAYRYEVQYNQCLNASFHYYP
jgi:hypothetical protein